MGGGIVLHAARTGMDLKAVASFHGSLGGKITASPGTLKAPILVMNGQADPFVSSQALEGFKQEMDAAKADYKLVNYPGAKHSFTNPDADTFGKKYGLPLAYDKKADTQSWSEMSSFLSKHMPLKKKP